ncbi:uncharacterized protein Ibf1 [Drosophila bipectinata]|uniref:uncharacterized protein Ibf1 n=1 Tax=Drosophila bipectinata TaxID=42026 RepID=UPI0007E692AB|nr:uncharacterized protein LOC108119743 isoform X2 [Drosophila bipectinata]
MPRKKSEDFYRTHGFTANLSNGKYSATCHYCDRVLQNTALSRLSLHRQTCDQKRGRYTESTRKKSDETDSYDDAPRIKIQKISSAEDDDYDNATEGKEIIVKIQQILDAADEESGAKRPTIIKSEILQQSDPKGLSQGQQVEIQISNEDGGGQDYIEYVNDSKEHYIIPENLDDSGQEATTIVHRPKNNLASLRAEKARAEIKQFQSKTKFLKTETENLKVVRTLTLLRIQKLRLEIDALRAQN